MTSSARKWTYAGVMLGFAASITANIASTVLTATEVSLALRVPFAVFWPLATYVAIEVLTRTDWVKGSLSHRGIRALLWLPVGGVAAFVSYLHQNHLMGLAGEHVFAQAVGPIAVDMLLFGCTATLIITRNARAQESTNVDAEVERLTAVLEMREREQQEALALEMAQETLEIPTEEPAALPAPEVLPELPAPVSPAAPRAARMRSNWDAAKVIDMLTERAPKAQILAATGVSPTSYGRLSKVFNLLLADRNAAVDTAREKVNPEHVQMIRRALAR